MGKRGASATPPSAKAQKVGLKLGPWSNLIHQAALLLGLDYIA